MSKANPRVDRQPNDSSLMMNLRTCDGLTKECSLTHPAFSFCNLTVDVKTHELSRELRGVCQVQVDDEGGFPHERKSTTDTLSYMIGNRTQMTETELYRLLSFECVQWSFQYSKCQEEWLNHVRYSEHCITELARGALRGRESLDNRAFESSIFFWLSGELPHARGTDPLHCLCRRMDTGTVPAVQNMALSAQRPNTFVTTECQYCTSALRVT